MTRVKSVRAGILLLIPVLLAACGQSALWPDDIFSYRIDAFEGPVADLSSLKDNRASVFVFLAPDCPLSENYTLTLNSLFDEFADRSVGFYGVVAGDWFESSEIAAFIDTYALRFPLLLDRDFDLAEHFRARVTPEVFVVDETGELRYQGAIDNWSSDLGQHRTIITAHYLRDALSRMARGRLPEIIATQATGCYIERIG